jgi:SAM-dependent methyltransferase
MNFDQYEIEYQDQISNDEFETQLIAIRRRQVLDIAKTLGPRTFLEVGCGLNSLFNHLQDFDQFVILEPVKRFCEIAESDSQNDSSVTIFNCTLENGITVVNTFDFDLIVASSVLHEVPAPDQFLQSIYQVSDLGTHVYIDVPNVESFHRLLGLQSGLIDELDQFSELENRFGRKSHFTKSSLIESVEKAGFQVIRCFTFFLKPFASHQMQRLLDSNIIAQRTLTGLSKLCEHFPDNGSSIGLLAKKR